MSIFAHILSSRKNGNDDRKRVRIGHGKEAVRNEGSAEKQTAVLWHIGCIMGADVDIRNAICAATSKGEGLE